MASNSASRSSGVFAIQKDGRYYLPLASLSDVFGFYVAPILFVITCTATFFSFKWPAEILKQVTSTPAVSIKATALPTPVAQT